MNNKSLKIYYLSSEIDPFSNTYSLAKFSKEFNSFLNEFKDIDIRLIQPKYGYISERKYILREVIRLKDLNIEFQNKNHIINLKSAFIPNTRVQLYFMEHQKYFTPIPDLLYKSRNGRVYNNNHEKFTFFVKAVLESLTNLFWYPDIIVCNDWQMSMLPFIFKKYYKNSDQFKKTKIVSFLHSYDKMYEFPTELFKGLDLDCNSKQKQQNTLEMGLQYSDKVYVFDDGQLVKNLNKRKKIKNALGKYSHKILNVQDLDYSDKVDLFSLIKEDLNSISKK